MSNSIFSKKNNGLGLGLFNEASKELIAEQERKENESFKIEYINVWNLLPNEKNKDFSMDEIEDLKASILDVGLQQNLVVTPWKDGQYKILTGHRRREALFQLIQEGHKELLNVPCIVRKFEDIDLPLSDELKEKYAIATTNAEVRKNTPADLKKLMEMLSDVYDELKKQGYKNLGKRQNYLAEKLGISTGTIGTINYIDKNLNENLKQDFESGKLPMRTANKIAHLPPEEQKKFIDKQDGENITADDIAKHRKDIEKRRARIDTDSGKKYTVTQNDFEFCLDIQKEFENTTNVVLSNAEYNRIQKAKTQIIKQQEIIKNIINKNKS